MADTPKKVKTVTDEQIAEIKRIVAGGQTHKDLVLRAYGLTEAQVLNS